MTQDQWDKAEDFMEGYMLDLTYDIVTQKIKLTDLIDSDEEVILAYDPFGVGETDQVWLLQDLIDYYIETEEYERCAKLLSLKVQVEKGSLDLSKRIYLNESDFEIPEAHELAVKRLIDEVLNNKWNKN